MILCDRDFWMIAGTEEGALRSAGVYKDFDPSLRRASLIGNTVVLVVVLFPLVGNPRFALLSGTGATYLGLLGALNAWIFYGPPLFGRWLGDGLLARALHFGGMVALFAGVYWLRVPNSNLWLLAMPIVAAAVILLRWPGVLAVAILLLGVIAMRLARGAGWNWSRETATAVSQLAVAMIFTAGCTLLAVRERASRTRAEKLAAELESANSELRAAADRNAEFAAVRERNRIARDIHDGLGHYLTTIAVQLQAAHALLPMQPDKALEVVAKAEHGAQQALAEVRRSVGALREPGAEADLVERIGALVAECGLEVAFIREGEARPLSPMIGDALFRTAQEALTNVRKHSGSHRATVHLGFLTPSGVVLAVSDDGSGATSAADSGGFGLRGLRERLAAVGGTLSAGNRPEGGFRVVAEVRS